MCHRRLIWGTVIKVVFYIGFGGSNHPLKFFRTEIKVEEIHLKWVQSSQACVIQLGGQVWNRRSGLPDDSCQAYPTYYLAVGVNHLPLLLHCHVLFLIIHEQQHYQVTTTNFSTKSSSSSMNSLLAKKWPRTRLKVQSAWHGTPPSLLLARIAAGKWGSAWGLHRIHRVFPTTIVPYMINSRRHYCRSYSIAFRKLDSFAQDVSEVHKRSLMFNTRWKTAEGLPNNNGSQ